MKSTFSLIFALLTILSTAEAQSNWTSASLTTKNGKTMTGEVDDRQWSGRIDKVDFRTGKKSPPQSFDVSDIALLLVGDQEFLGQTVEFNASPRNKQELVTGEEKVYRSAYGLLKVLIGGSVDLLQFYDEKGEDHYFLRDSDGNVRYLEYGAYRKDYSNQKSTAIEMNGFRNFLLKRFSDCGSLSAAIVSTTYNELSLISLFEDFYACTGAVIKQRVVSKSSWSFGVTAGFMELVPLLWNFIPEDPLNKLSPVALTLGGRLIYYPSGFDSGSAFYFGVEHFQYEFMGSSGQMHPYKREQTIRFSAGPRIYLTNGEYKLYGEFLVGYDLLIKFEQTTPGVIDGDDSISEKFFEQNGDGKISIGLNMGIRRGRADLSLRSFMGNRNFKTRPFRESLFGLGVVLGYYF